MFNWRREAIIPFLTWFFVTVVVLAAVFYLRNIAMLVFLSFIFAAALHPVVTWGKRWKIPVGVSIFVSYIVIFVVISFLLSLVVPPLMQQSMQLASTISQRLGVQEFALNGWARLEMDSLATTFDQYGSMLNQVTGSLRTAANLIASTFSFFFIFFTWIVISSHMLSNMDELAVSFAWLLPGSTKAEQAKKARYLMAQITKKLGGWTRGQLALMLIMGLATYIGLVFLGVPFALPLAILAGLLEIVPNLGPTISSIPGIAAAFFLVNPLTGLFTTIFYIIVQQLENNFLVPAVMREAIDVRPLTTIILMLVGFQVMGVVGSIVILPAYITIRTIVTELYPDSGPWRKYV